jgi:cytochrome c
MSARRQFILVLIVPALGLIIYGLYLVAGGKFGREKIKAQLAIRTTPHTMSIRSSDGGDCEAFGDWDGESAACTMTSAPPAGTVLRIADDGITLEGAGHTMTGAGDGIALQIIDRSDVTVRNLTVRNYRNGVVLQHSTRVALANNTVLETSSHAIQLRGLANHNTVVDNVIGPTSPDGHGIELLSSHGNLLAGNMIFGVRDAVRLMSSHGNTITWNLTAGSMIEGVDLHRSRNNTVVFNDLMEETAAPLLDDLPAGANTYTVNAGGNHYLQFSSAAQGCVDEDSDGYCDAPYRFFADGVDLKPSVQRWTDIDAAMAVFDVTAPQAVCTGCHPFDLASSEEQTIAGPDVRSIVGRPIAGEDGFAYSEALRGVGGVWTEELLHRFLTSPQEFAPGTKMMGIAIRDAEARQQIIDYLGDSGR